MILLEEETFPNEETRERWCDWIINGTILHPQANRIIDFLDEFRGQN